MKAQGLTHRIKHDLQRRVEAIEAELACYEQYHWEVGRELSRLEAERQELLESLQRICKAEQLYRIDL